MDIKVRAVDDKVVLDVTNEFSKTCLITPLTSGEAYSVASALIREATKLRESKKQDTSEKALSPALSVEHRLTFLEGCFEGQQERISAIDKQMRTQTVSAEAMSAAAPEEEPKTATPNRYYDSRIGKLRDDLIGQMQYQQSGMPRIVYNVLCDAYILGETAAEERLDRQESSIKSLQDVISDRDTSIVNLSTGLEKLNIQLNEKITNLSEANAQLKMHIERIKDQDILLKSLKAADGDSEYYRRQWRATEEAFGACNLKIQGLQRQLKAIRDTVKDPVV